MNFIEITMTLALAGSWVAGGWYAYRRARWENNTDREQVEQDLSIGGLAKITADHTTKIGGLTTRAKRFDSPEALATDMERTADLIENRMAKRADQPRPGTEPHARISRINSRGRSGWDKK